MDKIKDEIRAFINAAINNHELLDDEDIFEAGYINSLFAMQLVLFVEEKFQLVVENEDLELDNFRSVNALAHLVERKKMGTGLTAAT